jgi:Zn-dependent protease with chaperone function
MSLLPIILVAAILAVDGGLRPLGADWHLEPAAITVLTLGPVALVVLAMTLGVWWCDRRLTRLADRRSGLEARRGASSHRTFIYADRLGRAARTLIIIIHLASVLVFGWLGTVRSIVGDPILLDEIITLSPAILGVIGTWWAYYPIDRRLHEAILIRQLDEGQPVYPTLSRSAFVLMQTRLHLLLVLAPVLLIAGCTEVIGQAGRAFGVGREHWIVAVGKVVVGAGVFMLAPLLARMILDVKPMPLGPLRDALLEVCNRHRVKIRELLIWHTNGSVFNAAVMGLTGRLRYVMITDALLETMREDQVRAVMAHEIGHVRRRHLPWMVATLIACFIVVELASGLLWLGVAQTNLVSEQVILANGTQHAAACAYVAASFFLFGWVCRRFERQADTFAVQHLSIDDSTGTYSTGRGDSERVQDVKNIDAPTSGAPLSFSGPSAIENRQSAVSASAVHTMCDALEAIAHLNGIDARRKSWRHGSIAWRMEYLLSLIGRPVCKLPIDSLIKRIKLATFLIVVAAIVLTVIQYFRARGTAA